MMYNTCLCPRQRLKQYSYAPIKLSVKVLLASSVCACLSAVRDEITEINSDHSYLRWPEVAEYC